MATGSVDLTNDYFEHQSDMTDLQDLNESLRLKLSPRLAADISHIDIRAFTRIPPSRLLHTAVPIVGLIELVSADDFADKYNDLYMSMFHGGERERTERIVERLYDEFAGTRVGRAPYRIVGIRNHASEGIGAAHFSVLPVNGQLAVPYLQYIYVRPECRRRDISELLHALILAVATAYATTSGLSPDVPFTMFETAPSYHNPAAEGITKIHSRGGSMAMMLRRKDGTLLTPHVQPGLERGEQPLTLAWVLRASPINKVALDDLLPRVGPAVGKAYYRTLRDEGFPEENVALAERIFSRREKHCEYCLISLADIRQEMCVQIDNP